MDVFDAVTGKVLHHAYAQSYTPRSSGSNTFALFWDGNMTAGDQAYQVPNAT